jgi:hypothetical protein
MNSRQQEQAGERSGTVPAPEGFAEKSVLEYALPLAVPIISLCLYIAAVQLPFILAYGRTGTLALIGLVLAVINAVAAQQLTGRWYHGIPSAMLAVGGFGYLMLIGGTAGRYLLIGVLCALLAVYFSFLERHGRPTTGDVRLDYERLSLMMLAPSTFFLFTFGFALIEHQVVGRAWVTPVAALLMAFLTWEMVRRLRIAAPTVALLLAASAVLGAQFFLAVSLLPLSHLVSAAALVIVLSLALQRMHDAVAETVHEAAFRRQAAFSLLLLIAILVTAQWQ